MSQFVVGVVIRECLMHCMHGGRNLWILVEFEFSIVVIAWGTIERVSEPLTIYIRTNLIADLPYLLLLDSLQQPFVSALL